MSPPDIHAQEAARRALDKAAERAQASAVKTRRDQLKAIHIGRDARISVDEIATRLGVTRATIYTWLKDERDAATE